MPVTPSHFHKPRVVNHAIDFWGGDVKFIYDANNLRDSWINEWAALEAQGDSGKLNEMLDDLIINWDIQNEDGTVFPKTPEAIGELFTIPDKTLILRELMTALNPSSEEGNESSTSTADTAPQAASSEEPSQTSPNGSAVSPLPNVSASPSVT